MSENSQDDIIITALMKRLTEIRLPRALALEKRVLAGNTLTESDLAFLDLVFHDAQYVFKLSDIHPEYQEIVAKTIQLYKDITEKALENEKKHPPTS